MIDFRWSEAGTIKGPEQPGNFFGHDSPLTLQGFRHWFE